MLDTDWVPSTEKNSKRLMLVLHGLGDSMEGYRDFPMAFDLPGMNYCLVNAPDPYYGGFSWYDIYGKPGPGIVRSRELLFALLDDCRARGHPTEQTTLFGFSQGCLMTLEVGCRYPHKLAALVGVSGYVHEPEKLLEELSPVAREQRFLVTHGTVDPLLPFAVTREHINLLKAAGLHMEFHEFVKAHTIAGRLEVDLITEFVRKCYGESSPGEDHA